MGRKIVTKETQEGCLSFSINKFSEHHRSSENLLRLAKGFFDSLSHDNPAGTSSFSAAAAYIISELKLRKKYHLI